jgi:DNA-binding FrmR family transcriptional regulator
MLPERKDKILMGIKKSRGMLDKIDKMLSEWSYCADIAQQINATIGLLRSANTALLENHIQTCGVSRIQSGDPKAIADFSEEVMRVWNVTQRN